jgi:signal transduction histidine kinase
MQEPVWPAATVEQGGLPDGRFRAMMDAFGVAYCLIELIHDDAGAPVDYRFVEVSDGFIAQTGFIDPVGRRISDISPIHEQEYLQLFDGVARTGNAIRFSRPAAVLGGRTFDVRACRVGEPERGLVAIWSADVSENIAEKQRQRDYIAMVSHDLGTPMTLVRAQAQMLRRRRVYDEERVGQIVAQVDRMERLLSGLRNVVRAEHGWLERRVISVDLALLMLEAVERGRSQSPGHRIDLVVDDPVIGYWDAERIEQILDNLIGNAIKYSAIGSQVLVRLSADETTVRFSIADEGVGIAPEALPMLFDRFYRASEGGAVKGMGLGLYIVRTLVHAKGGSVTVTSEEGRGSTFTVELPRHSTPPGSDTVVLVQHAMP